MAMTHEERLELLKVAREAKAKKRQERLDNEPPKSKGRPKKMPEPVVEEPVEEVEEEPVVEVPKAKAKPKAKKVLNASNAPNVPQKSLTLPAEKLNADDDMEVVQDVITEYQTQVVKKPKKKIVKKIVYESNSDDEIVEEIEYKKSDKPKKVIKKQDTPTQAQREPQIDMIVNTPSKISSMFFNY